MNKADMLIKEIENFYKKHGREPFEIKMTVPALEMILRSMDVFTEATIQEYIQKSLLGDGRIFGVKLTMINYPNPYVIKLFGVYETESFFLD